MIRPPRNLKTDRLMSSSLIVYCYCFAGFLNIAAGFIGYILAFNSHGLSLTDLFMSVQKHFIVGAEDFHANGQVFNEEQQVQCFSSRPSLCVDPLPCFSTPAHVEKHSLDVFSIRS